MWDMSICYLLLFLEKISHEKAYKRKKYINVMLAKLHCLTRRLVQTLKMHRVKTHKGPKSHVEFPKKIYWKKFFGIYLEGKSFQYPSAFFHRIFLRKQQFYVLCSHCLHTQHSHLGLVNAYCIFARFTSEFIY